MTKPTIHILLGSTRPNRAGKAVYDWLEQQLEGSDRADFKFIDLAEVHLPMFNEPIPPSAGKYEHEHTKQWSKVIAEADGYIWITPEYNNGYPAVLKNAIDYLYQEWNRKAVAFVSYGNIAGGTRAVQQLKQVASELQMAAVKSAITIPLIWNATGEERLDESKVHGDVNAMLDDLLWWTQALKDAREDN